MAKLQSTGLHEPHALQYLISEGLFPENADASLYKWSQQLYVDEQGRGGVEEILHTDRCVTWSRNKIIKRVFNLDVEGEAILHAFSTSFPSPSNEVKSTGDGGAFDRLLHSKEPALVVVLKTQAHIFSLSAGIHVIPLSFEVVRALPFSGGCILQGDSSPRAKLPKSEPGRSTARWENASTRPSKASIFFENGNDAVRPHFQASRSMPTYCITDLLSELGLVAASYARRPDDLNACPLLSPDEEVLYISTDAHLPTNAFGNVCVAVTLNRNNSTVTVWQVEASHTKGQSSRSQLESSRYRKRQSSDIHERSRVPSGRGAAEPSRESFGGLMQSFVENEAKPQGPQLSSIENLAAELGQDFAPSGVQTRSARRISSMLARTDLAPANDRSTFNDNAISSRKSLSRSIRKEGSFGSFTERNSFGGRKSYPANTSIYSNTTSFLDPGGRLSTGEGIGSGGIDDHTFELLNERLQKAVTFIKLKSFVCDEASTHAAACDFKIMLIPHPVSVKSDDSAQLQFSVCILEARSQAMTVVTIAIERNEKPERFQQRPELKAIQIQKGNNIADACQVSDDQVNRLIVLSKTLQGDDVLHLEAPWSSSFRLDMPIQYLIRRSNNTNAQLSTSRKQNDSINRVTDGRKVKISHFVNTFNLNGLAISDTMGLEHELRITLLPKKSVTARIIQLCKFVLPAQLQDSMLVAYWEIVRWLEVQDVTDGLESTGLAVVLFVMAVPFINSLHKSATPGRKKKGAHARSSSGPFVNVASWSAMQDAERSKCTLAWTQSAAWSWTSDDSTISKKPKSPAKHDGPASLDVDPDSTSVFLTRCTDLTTEFLQSPAGENMSGPEGYLPTAMNQDRNIRRTALASIVVALYLLVEELRLEMLVDEALADDRAMLCALIGQLSTWLNWPTWKAFMEAQLMNHDSSLHSPLSDKLTIDNLDVPPEPFSPTSVFELVDSLIHSRPLKYHTLIDLVQNSDAVEPESPLWLEAGRLLPHTNALVSLFSPLALNGKAGTVDHSKLIDLPEVIAKACQQAIVASEASPKLTKSLHVSTAPLTSDISRPHHFRPRTSHAATRDIRIMCNQALDAESLGRWDASSEMDRQAVTRLIFNQDRRFQEASKLLNQGLPPELEYDHQPNWTEADALEAQKLLTQYATRRTFAVVSGRGMMYFNARTPLLTEMVPRAQFSMQCILRPKVDTEGGQPMTFSADRSMFTEDKVCWAFFHNGASAGLMISKEADFIDTSWILYNKPPELTNRHAGFLLALGLNGHLKSLARWVAFKYLTPKHTMTSVGLLLGLAATYRGTADTMITRLLSVHVTCLLPPGAAELNLSPLTQMTGILGIGLLYHDSQHRRMSEVMLSEVEAQDSEEPSGDEPILRDEGYRLSAGMALGLINLGHGHHLHALHDMRVIERLLAVGVGTKNVNLVHVLDRATAGAVVAIAFMFMKTNDVSVAKKVDIPDTLHQFDYVRPDIFLLRTLARHLIMWDSIHPTASFIQESLPQQHRHRANLRAVKRLVTNDLPFFHVVAGICFALALRYAGSQRQDVRDLLVSYLDNFIRLSRVSALNYDAKVTLNGIRNCLDILALSCATVMAGSGDLVVYRRLRALHGRTDKDTPFGSHLAAHMAIGALFLSGGTATFGTTNLAVAALVIAFYPLFPTDVLDNRGHLQALRHLWVLAVEHRSLVLRDKETGQVLSNVDVTIALKNDFVTTLRTPGLLPELETIKAISASTDDYWPVSQDLDQVVIPHNNKGTSAQERTLRDIYKSSTTGINISLCRRALYDKRGVDPFDAELTSLNNVHGIPSATSAIGVGVNRALNARDEHCLDWVFNLPAFIHLDHAERALVLSGSAPTTSGPDNNKSPESPLGRSMLETTPIDTSLDLDLGTLGPEHIATGTQKPLTRDKLWQIRLLLSLADKMEAENNQQHKADEGNRTWLRNEVTEKLRWRIWKMSGSGGTEHEHEQTQTQTGQSRNEGSDLLG
ncbi:Anaphase-promoting complex subunit 1 [Exophiala xenobiotica]|uniref:Anaphase-promoting complex subunit 1 n=1 Tax=Lithohypha guttulata TaxID=1690604 RepID=A0ABR0K997_9EURO|nr:Anaphase-promoting complex subunit 1 [Lithohypha guttulata]KAK5326899.1 Anaphase-promoting complex subunit 1 [Exophiala xenobiotica]